MSNVRVAVRVRPLSRREIDHNAKSVVEVLDDTVSVTNLKVDPTGYGDSRERRKKFTFDHCYDSTDPSSHAHASQEQVFQDLGTDVLASALEGYNACLFAYGQTGSGKTHTMMGYQAEIGLIPRICEGLFARGDDGPEEEMTFKVEVSYLEIYNERVRDLLQQSELSSSEGRYTLKVREHPKEGPYVQDLSKHLVKDYEEIKTILDRGNENRTTAATYMHDHSSRSHAIFTVIFTQAKFENDLPSETVSKINLVDLAGSERADPAFSSDYKGRLKEGANINKSLVTLGSVIKTLAERSLLALSTENLGSMQNVHSEGTESPSPPASSRRQRQFYVPYRDSVLTWLLKDSLGGNSKTIMIATITPASSYYNETISTLRYAQRAKSIINRPHVNEDPNVKLIRELRREIDRLRSMLATAHMQRNHSITELVFLNFGKYNQDGSTEAGSLMSLQDSGSLLEARLEENEAMAQQLTQSWIDKWEETQHVMKETDLSIRGLGRRSSSHGVIIDIQLPHLIGMDEDILNTGILIYNLKEGSTRIGVENSRREPDIVLNGPAIKKDHCVIKNKKGQVTLHPKTGASVSINGIDIKEPTALTQGDVILFGKTHIFRFNNPAQAAILREHRKSLQENSLDMSEVLSSSPSLSDSYQSSNSPFRIFNPNLSAAAFCVELDKKFPTEIERIEKARCELEKIREERLQAEDKEADIWDQHTHDKAQVDAEKQKLLVQISQLQEEKYHAEETIEESKRKLREEELKYREHLSRELIKLEALKAKQSQDFGSQTEGVGTSAVDTAIQPEEEDDEEDNDKVEEPPISGPIGQEIRQRRMSFEGRAKKIAEEEFLHVLNHKEIVEQLVKEEEAVEDRFEEAEAEIVQGRERIKELEAGLREREVEHAAALELERQQLAELQRQEEQLELYIQHKKDLMMVEADTPRPLRGACSEEFLTNSPRPEEDLLSKTRSLNTLTAEDTMSELSSTSMQSLGSSVSIDMQSQESLSGTSSPTGAKSRSRSSSLSQEAKKISSKAMSVTERLYKRPKPREDLEGNYLKKKERDLPPPGPRSYRSRSPLVSPSNSPARPRAAKPGPGSKGPKTPGKSGAQSRTSRSPGGSRDKVDSPDRKPPKPALLRPRSRIRQLASSSSLASVPEAAGEEGEAIDSTTQSVPNIPSVDTSSVVRRKKKSRGSASNEDEFRRHSDPYGEQLASALEEYTNSIQRSYRREGCTFAESLSQEDLDWKGSYGEPRDPSESGHESTPDIVVTDLSDSTATASTVHPADCDTGDQNLGAEEPGEQEASFHDELTPRVDTEVSFSGDDLTPRVDLVTGWTQTTPRIEMAGVLVGQSQTEPELRDADTSMDPGSSISCQTDTESMIHAGVLTSPADLEKTKEVEDKACMASGAGGSDHEFSMDSLEDGDSIDDESGIPEKRQRVSQEDQSCQTNSDLIDKPDGARTYSRRGKGEDECSQLSDDSLAGAHAELQVLQQVLDHINSAGSGPNGRKSKKHRQTSRQSKGSGSENGDQLSDDSLNTGNHSRSSSRPGSASRRRKKPASRSADVATKRHRAGHSSEEYATSDDSLYSEDSLTQERHHRGAEQDGAPTTAQEIASISSSVQQLTAAIDASASGSSVDPPSAVAALQSGDSASTDQPDMPDTATQTSSSTAGMGVSPVSIWSSKDMQMSTPVDWSTSHCGVQTVSEQNSVSKTNRRSWNLSITPVDMWTSPAALEALKLSDSDSELGNTTDSGIDVRRFRAGNRWGEPGQAEGMTTEGFQQMSHLSPGDPDRTPSPSSPKVRTEEVHTFPGDSAAASQGRKPVKFEVTINEDNTKILYNVEKTEYKTYALKDKSPEAGSSGSTSSIPDAIKINMTQTKMIHTDDRSENVRREQILMQSSDSSASDGERIVSQKMLRAKHLYERDLETSGEDISRESSVERQFLDTDFSSYVTGSLRPAVSAGQDNVDAGAAVMAGTDLPSMGDQDSGLDTMLLSGTPDSSLAFQYGDAGLAAMSSRCIGTTTSGSLHASPSWQFPQLVVNTSRKTQQGQVPEDYAVAVALNNSLNLSSSFDAKRRSHSQERRQASDELDSGNLSQSRLSSTELRSASEGRIPTSAASSSEAASASVRGLSREAADLSSPSVTTTSLRLGLDGEGSESSAASGSASAQGASHLPGRAQGSASQGLSATSFLSSSLEKLQNMVEETFPLGDVKEDQQRASESLLINQDSVRIGVIVTTSPRSDTSPRVLDHTAQGLFSHHHHPPVPHSFAYSQWISEHESQPSFTVAGARSNVAGPIDLGLPRRSSVPQMAALTVSGGAAHATAGGLEPAVREVAQARVSSSGHPLHMATGSSGVYGGVPLAVTQSSLVRDLVPGTSTLGSSMAHSAQPAPSAQLSCEVRETDTEHTLDFHDKSSSISDYNTTDPRASGSMHAGSALSVAKSVGDDLETAYEHAVEFVDEGSSTFGHDSEGKGTPVNMPGESTVSASQEASPEECEDDEKETESEHSIIVYYEGAEISGNGTPGRRTRPENLSVPLSTDDLGSDEKSPFSDISPGERETIIEHSVHYIDEDSSHLDETTADARNLEPDQRGSASHQGTGTTQNARPSGQVPPAQTNKGESTEKDASRQISEEEKETVSEYNVDFYDDGSTMHGDRGPSGLALKAQQKVQPAQTIKKGESHEKVPSRRTEEKEIITEHTVNFYDEGSTMLVDNEDEASSGQALRGPQKVQPAQTAKRESTEKSPSRQLSEEERETVSEYTVNFYDEGSTMLGDRSPNRQASGAQQKVPPVQTTVKGESSEKVPSKQISEKEKETTSEYTVAFYDDGSTMYGERAPSGPTSRAQQKVPSTQTIKQGESTEKAPSRQLSEEKETVSEYTMNFYDEGSTIHGDRVPGGQASKVQQKVPSAHTAKQGEDTEKGPSRQQSDKEKETISEYTVDFYDDGSTSLGDRARGGQSSSALQKMPSTTAVEQKPADSLSPQARQKGGQAPTSPTSQLPGEERETTSEYTVDFYDGGSSHLEEEEGSSVDGPLAPQGVTPDPSVRPGLGSAERGQSAGLPDEEKETVSEYTVDFYDGGSVRTDDIPASKIQPSNRQNAPSPIRNEQDRVKKSPSKQSSDKERETVSEYSVDFYDEGSSYLGSDRQDRRVPVPQQKGPSSPAASQEGAKAQKPPGQQLTDEDRETVSEYTINYYDDGSTNLGDRNPVVSLQRGSAQQDQRAGPSQGGSAGETKGATSSHQQTVNAGSAGSAAKQTRGGHDDLTPTASPRPQPSTSTAPSTLQSGPVVILSRTTSPHGRVSSTEIKKGAPPPQVDFMTLEKGATLIRPKSSSSLSPLSRSPRQSQSSSGRSTPRKTGSEKGSNSEEETCFEEVIEIAAPDMKYYMGSNKFAELEVRGKRAKGADVGRDRPGNVSTSSDSSNYRTPLQSPRVNASPSESPRSPHGGSSSPVGGVSSVTGQAQEGVRVSRESFDLRPGSVYTSGSESDYQSPRSHFSNSTPPLHPLGLRTGASLASGSESDFFSPRSTMSETNEDSSGEMTARPSQTAREARSAVDARLPRGSEDEGSSVDPRREEVKRPSGSDLVTSAALSSPFSTASDRSSAASTSAISTPTSNSEKPMQQLHPGSTALPSKVSVAGRFTQPTKEEQELLAALENENIRENLRREVEKRIASLQRRVRSLSDSAISSDFTDVESNSVSPRSSRLREGEKPFGEVGTAFSDRNIFVGHAAASLNSSYPRGQGLPGLGAPEAWKSAGLKQADSGNVYDGEDAGSDASSTIVASPEPPGDGSFDSRLSLNSEVSRGTASRSQDDGEVDRYLRTSRLDSARDRPEIQSGEVDGRVSGLHKMLASPDYRTFRQGLLDQQEDSAVGGGRQLPKGTDQLDRGIMDALHPEMVTTHRNISQSSDQSESDPFNMSKGWIGGEMAGRFHGLFELGEGNQPSARMPRTRRQMSSYRPLRSEDVWYTLPPSTEHCEQQRHQLTVSNPWSFEKCFIYQPRPQGRYPERLIDAILAIRRYPLLQSLSASTLRRPGSKKPGPRFRGRRTRSLDDLPGVAYAAALRSLMEVTYRQRYPHGVSQYPSSGSFEITSQRLSSPSGTENSLSLSGYGDGASASASGGPEGVTLTPGASLLQRGLFMGDLTQSLPDGERPSGQILRQLPPRVLLDEDLLYQCYRRSSQVSQQPLSPEEIRLARQAVEELLLNVPWEDYRSGRAGASATDTTITSGRQPSYRSTVQSGDASTSFHDSEERRPEVERYESQDDSNLQSPKEACMEHNSSSDSITFVFVGKSQRNEDMQPDGEMSSPISAEFRNDDDSYRGRSVSEYSTTSSDPEESTGYRGQHTFWPISERSVSSDNIPKQLEKPMTLHRSRSASLLDVESAVDDFQGSIFPSHPVDTDRESVSSRRSSSISCLYDNSDYPSSRPSPSVEQWRGVRDGSLDSDRASDVDTTREQTLEESESQQSTATGSGGDASDGSLLTPGRNATSTPLTPSPMASPAHRGISLSIQTSDEALAQGRGFYMDEHGLQLPHSHRPTSSHSARGASRLSRRLSYSDSNLYIRHRHHHQADHAAFAIGSSDSLLLIGTSSSGPGTDFLDSTGEGADSHHVTGLYKTHSLNLVGGEGRQASDIGAEEAEGPSWYTLSAMMLETTSLLKSIQERIPGTSLSSASSPPASASNGSVVHRGRMCESGVQTGGSLSDVHSAEMQTETEVVMVDSVTSMMDSASLDDFNTPLLHSSETQTSESRESSMARSVQTASQMADSSSMTEAAHNQTVGTDTGSFLGEAEASYTGAWAAQLYSTSQDKPVHTAEAAVGDEPVDSSSKSTAEVAVGADSDTTPPKSDKDTTTTSKPRDKLRSSRRKKLEHADSFSQTETDADYIHFLVAQDREHQRQSSKLSPRSLEMEAGRRSTTPTRLLRPLSRARSADVEGYGERMSPVSLGQQSRDSSSQTDQISLHTVGTDSMPEDKAVSTDGLQVNTGTDPLSSVSSRVSQHSIGVQKNDFRTVGLSTRDDRQYHDVKTATEEDRVMASMSSQTEPDSASWAGGLRETRASPSGSPSRGRDSTDYSSTPTTDAEVQALASGDADDSRSRLDPSQMPDVPGYDSNEYIMAEISKLKEEHAKMMQLLERSKGQQSRLTVNTRDGKFRSSDSNPSEDVSPVTVIERTALSPQGDIDSPPNLDQRLPSIIGGRTSGQTSDQSTQMDSVTGGRSSGVEGLQLGSMAGDRARSSSMGSEGATSQQMGSGVDRALLYLSSTSSARSGSSRSSDLQSEDIVPSSLLGSTISDRVSTHLGLRHDQDDSSASSLFKPVPVHSSDKQSRSSGSSRRSTGSQADSQGERNQNSSDISHTSSHSSSFRSLSSDRLGRMHPGSFVDAPRLQVPGRSSSADATSSSEATPRNADSSMDSRRGGRQGDVVGDILSDDASVTPRMSPVADQLEEQDSWLSTSSLDSSLRRFISTGVEVAVDSSDEFTQTDVERGGAGRVVATTTEGIQVELERLQKERLQIIELLSLNYLPSSLTVELLEAKLNYCIGQTDMLLATLDENATLSEEHGRPDYSRELAVISEEYLTRYRHHFQQDKRDIAACMEALQQSQQGGGRGRRRTRNKDLRALRRRAEIEAFKLERQREQQLHERARSASPYQSSAPSPDSSGTEFSPSYMTPRQLKNHLLGLRKHVVQASHEELRSRSLSPFLDDRSLSPDYQPQSVYSSRESSMSLGFTPESSPSPEPRRDSLGVPPRSRSLGSHSSSTESGLNRAAQMRSLSSGSRSYRFCSPTSRLYPRHSFPSRLAAASWSLDPQALLEETAAIRYRNRLQISQAHRSIRSSDAQRSAISSRYHSSSHQMSLSSSARPHSPSVSVITDEEIDKELESLKKEHKEYSSSSPHPDRDTDPLRDSPGSPYASYAAYARDLLARSERSISQTLQSRGVRSQTPLSQVSSDLDESLGIPPPPYQREERYAHSRPVSSRDIRAHILQRRSQSSPFRH